MFHVYVQVCVCVCVDPMASVWYTAAHVGVDSRQTPLPDSFLNTTLPHSLNTHSQSKSMQLPTHTRSRLHTHKHINITHAVKESIQVKSFSRQPQPKNTFQYASCGDRLWACHTLMYSSTHSNCRSGALKSNQSLAC